jgi:hypothetical protein
VTAAMSQFRPEQIWQRYKKTQVSFAAFNSAKIDGIEAFRSQLQKELGAIDQSERSAAGAVGIAKRAP